MAQRGRWTVNGFVALVSATGAVIVVLMAIGARGRIPASDPATWLLAMLVVAGELLPLKIRRRNQEGEVNPALSFAFALLIHSGGPVAVTAIVCASAAADLLRGKPLDRIAFNVAQYVLCLTAAAIVLGAFTGPPAGVFVGGAWTITGMTLAFVAGGVAYGMNWLLTSTVIGLATGQSLLVVLRHNLAFTASTTGVLLTVAPVIVLIADRNLPLIPLILTTIAALYVTARNSLHGRHEAEHDELTGLANRRLLDASLADALESHDRVAVLLVDLDKFKRINDTLGHAVGDDVLRVVASRFLDCVRTDDVVARLGGDEFAILLPDPDDGGAELCARRLLEALADPVVVQGFPLEIGASVGVAVSPHDGATPEDLTRHADAAMYKAKESGSGYVVARRDNLQGWHGRLALLSDVAGALAEDQFVVHYQPIIRVRDDALIGVEALVRWEHPDHGLVMPGDFITLTESTDLIGPFTLMVLDKALGQLQEWRDEGHDISLSVNLAVANLLDVTLPAEVARLLSVHDVPADRLVLEITENTMMADPTRARGIIETLATMGVRIAIDDFGTGFSSLVHLKHLPVSIVKIDRSFVTGMLGDHDDATIVRSIVDLAANLGLQVTAEGVEHVDVYRALEGLDCTFAQGYLFSKPTTAADLRSWMRGHEAMRSLATRREDPRSTGEVLPFGTRSATPGPAVPAGGGEAIAR